ncbi:hypothetical protein KP509_13G070200 [Ceratopteris richardii]|uniref:Uncharacterized protein n=1 Tax=Ceratopteris richardii TaxID=49495 RepID=A0A8T2TIU6_CERRI|nr:hypothetical protein KP509_13G070200 [Ceratopteris richardii]
MAIALQLGVGRPGHARASRFSYGLSRVLQQQWMTQHGCNTSILCAYELCGVYPSQRATNTGSLPSASACSREFWRSKAMLERDIRNDFSVVSSSTVTTYAMLTLRNNTLYVLLRRGLNKMA